MEHIETAQQLAQKVRMAGGELWLIGGSVREMLYREVHPNVFIHPSKDLDMEVYGIEPETFERIIEGEGDVDYVGKQFGVYHLRCWNGVEIDFNFPRADSQGRRPEVAVDIHMSKYDACKRRNFTVNSAMYHPLDGEWVDYFNAKEDVERKCLHPVSLTTFPDDPLRPLIGMFLAGAYNMWPSFETEHICRQMKYEYDTLPASRIWGEWWKWATRSIKPSKGLDYLITTQWLQHYPELYILDTVPQDPEWHPEGNVMRHTWLAVDEAAIITRHWKDRERAGVVVLAALCHDLDKATCTTENEAGRIVSPGHDAGVEAEKFLNRIFAPSDIKERVLALVKTHMAHVSGMKPKKLLKRLGNNRPVDWLALVCADHSARPPLPKETPAEAVRLYHEMLQQPADSIEPIVTGKHLIALGHQGGPAMGMILRNIYELGQLEGRFDGLEDGIRWAYKQGWINNPYAGKDIKPEVLNAQRRVSVK